MVSEPDIIKPVASEGKLTSPVHRISTKRVVTVKASAEVAEVAKTMNKHRIRHVVVVDDDDKLKGVVPMRDLVEERARLTAILQSQEKEVFVGAD